jgi:hypothetical protein
VKEQLQQVRAWAQEKIASGAEPPWAWYQYMKLTETLDAILAGQASITTESSPQAAQPAGAHLRLVASTYQPDSARHDPADGAVLLPM